MIIIILYIIISVFPKLSLLNISLILLFKILESLLLWMQKNISKNFIRLNQNIHNILMFAFLFLSYFLLQNQINACLFEKNPPIIFSIIFKLYTYRPLLYIWILFTLHQSTLIRRRFRLSYLFLSEILCLII